jgi:signal peptidase I
MEPNFWDGEYLLADKITMHFKDFQRGDVVIFKETATADYIKRIIGFPGDTVELRDGKVYLNGSQLDEEEYLDPSVYTDGESYLKEGQSITVPEGKYFVFGDNRPHSSDSRAFGPIDKGKIKGRAVLIYWPFSKFEFLKRPAYD